MCVATDATMQLAERFCEGKSKRIRARVLFLLVISFLFALPFALFVTSLLKMLGHLQAIQGFLFYLIFF